MIYKILLNIFNSRLLVTNELLPVLDGKIHPDAEKISLKRLYELYRGTKSHGLVWLQFLSVLNLFFGGNIHNFRDAIAELYQNLTFETLSDRRQPQFEKISNLSSHINLKLQESIISNLNEKDKTTAKNNEKIEEKYNFLE